MIRVLLSLVSVLTKKGVTLEGTIRALRGNSRNKGGKRRKGEKGEKAVGYRLKAEGKNGERANDVA
jgi:hypothetical protein